MQWERCHPEQVIASANVKLNAASGTHRVLWAIAAASLALPLAGCGPSGPTQAELDASQRAAELAMQQECMANAFNSVRGHRTDSELEAAINQQSLSNCPVDFNERFVALRNTVRLYQTTQAEIRSHGSREREAENDAVAVTIGEIVTGQPSGSTPYSDWRNEGSELDQRSDRLRRQFSDESAAIRVVMARYGMVEQPTGQTPEAIEAAVGEASQ